MNELEPSTVTVREACVIVQIVRSARKTPRPVTTGAGVGDSTPRSTADSRFSDCRWGVDIRAVVQKQHCCFEVAVLHRDVEQRGSTKREEASTSRAEVQFRELGVHYSGPIDPKRVEEFHLPVVCGLSRLMMNQALGVADRDQ